MRTLRNVSCLRPPNEDKPYHLHSVDVRVDPMGCTIRGIMTLLYQPYLCDEVRFYVRLKTWKQVARHVVPFANHFGQYECFRSLLLSVDEIIRGSGLNKPVTYDGSFHKSEVNEVIRAVQTLRANARRVRPFPMEWELLAYDWAAMPESLS